jgi:hypothetical protein
LEVVEEREKVVGEEKVEPLVRAGSRSPVGIT